MKVTLIAFGLSLLAADAHAISNYNPTVMQCTELKARIRQEGVVMLRWTSPRVGVPRYGRYVRNSQFCSTGERAYGTIVPTRDKKACAVNDCRPFFHNDFF